MQGNSYIMENKSPIRRMKDLSKLSLKNVIEGAFVVSRNQKLHCCVLYSQKQNILMEQFYLIILIRFLLADKSMSPTVLWQKIFHFWSDNRKRDYIIRHPCLSVCLSVCLPVPSNLHARVLYLCLGSPLIHSCPLGCDVPHVVLWHTVFYLFPFDVLVWRCITI